MGEFSIIGKTMEILPQFSVLSRSNIESGLNIGFCFEMLVRMNKRIIWKIAVQQHFFQRDANIIFLFISEFFSYGIFSEENLMHLLIFFFKLTLLTLFFDC